MTNETKANKLGSRPVWAARTYARTLVESGYTLEEASETACMYCRLDEYQKEDLLLYLRRYYVR